jgi:collagenase-like PrtC family protease
MVDEFLLLGKCWMPSYYRVNPLPLPAFDGEGTRLIGSVKRGGAGVCYRVCEHPWALYRDGQPVAERLLPARQISRVTDLAEILNAGVDIVKLQGRSLPVDLLSTLTRRYRLALDAWVRGEAVPAVPEAPLEPSWTVARR